MTASFTNIPKSLGTTLLDYEVTTTGFPLSNPLYATYIGQYFLNTNNTKIDTASFYMERIGSPTIDIYAQIYNAMENNTVTLVNTNSASYNASIMGDMQFSMAFSFASTRTLDHITAYIFKTSTIGTMNAKIYAITGTIGVNALPTGTPLATSDDFNGNTLGSSSPVATPTTFTFSGANRIVLTPGNYALTIECASPNWGWDVSDIVSNGYIGYADGGTWATHIGKFIYSIYGIDTSAKIPSGSPLATSDSINASDLNEQSNTYTYLVAGHDETNYDYDIPLKTNTLSSILQDSYSETNQDSGYNTGSTSNDYYGQRFTVNDPIKLDTAKFYLKKSAIQTGNMVARIYAVDTDTRAPTGSALATSDNVDSSTLSLSYALTTFTFSGANQITLSAGTEYFLVYSYQRATGTGTVQLGFDNTAPAEGNLWYSADAGSTWTGQPSTKNICFYVYGFISGVFTGAGQLFTNTNNVTLTSANFYLKKTGSPTGNIYAVLTTTSPQNIPFEICSTSDIVLASSLSTSYTLITFTFSTPYNMDAGRDYIIYIIHDNGDTSNYITIGVDKTTTGDPNNFEIKIDGTWYHDLPTGQYENCYHIYGTSSTDYGGYIGGTTVHNYSWKEFVFSGNQQVTLSSGSEYFIVLHSNDPNTYGNTAITGVGFTGLPTGNAATSQDGTTWTATSLLSPDVRLYGLSEWSNREKSLQDFNNNNI